MITDEEIIKAAQAGMAVHLHALATAPDQSGEGEKRAAAKLTPEFIRTFAEKTYPQQLQKRASAMKAYEDVLLGKA